jgi:hypothetical protein
MIGFQRVMHGIDLAETGQPDFEVVFGKGSLW